MTDAAAPPGADPAAALSAIFGLAGKVALVTGSSRGLGWAMAQGLAQAGAHVLINARSAESCAKAAKDLRAQGFSAEALPFDATDPEAVSAAFATISGLDGGLDILIGNTAGSTRKGFETVTEAEWQGALDASLTPVWRLAREAAPLMRRRGQGRMIFTSSVNAMIVRNEMAAYAAAKAGLEGLVRALAVELAPDQITVNAIAPGYFATDGNTALRARPGMAERIAARVAMARWGRPEELASAALYLAAPATSFTTGITLTVDGGLRLTI